MQDVVSEHGKPCYIVLTLSCEATTLDLWMHSLSALTSFGIFYRCVMKRNGPRILSSLTLREKRIVLPRQTRDMLCGS